MKTLLSKTSLFIICIVCSLTVMAQNDPDKIDSLKKVLLTEKEDTNKVNTLLNLSFEYLDKNDTLNFLTSLNLDLALSKKISYKLGEGKAFRTFAAYYLLTNQYEEGLKNGNLALKIFKELNNQSRTADVYSVIAAAYFELGIYDEAIKNDYPALKIYEELNDKEGIGKSAQGIAGSNYELGNDSEALKYFFLALKIRKEGGNKTVIAQTYVSIGDYYLKKKNFSKAKQYHSEGLEIFKAIGENAPSWGLPFGYSSTADDYEEEGKVERTTGDNASANESFYKAVGYDFLALKLWQKAGREDGEAESFAAIGDLYLQLKKNDSARYYLEKSLRSNKRLANKSIFRDTYSSLSALDSIQGNYKQAYQEYKMYVVYRDSLNNEEAKKKSVQANMQYDFDKKEAIAKAAQDKKDAETKRTKNQQLFAIGGLAIIVLAIAIISLIQYRNNKHKQKANLLLQQQKEKIETTLSELKSTQSQLIQSEKMASLGELTAGIAHEIQNPLNFVNNFSEVNKELLIEMKDEIDKGNIDGAKTLANDVIDNEEKINHHGKRADAIVKGMLQHSRSSTGVKEPTDINALADEYLRLAYHGLRAKDKLFNATLQTDYDQTIGKINITPQDIGRVLLNLYTNAFYAVTEKLKQHPEDYEPTVSVSTKKLADKIEIRVRDNGNGIPQKVVDKIFQPFFTTKPTGQGTGLGLSLSYDIITKTHLGIIKAETKEGEFAEFVISLPA